MSAVDTSRRVATASKCDRRLSRAAREVLKRMLLSFVYGEELDQYPLLPQKRRDSYHHQHGFSTNINANNNDNNGIIGRHDVDHDQHIQEPTVWSLLYDILPAPIDPRSCIFHPDRDMHRQDEEHVDLVRAQTPTSQILPTETARERRKRNRRRRFAEKMMSGENQPKQMWYQCGYCGKTFFTLYYLDKHMEDRHGCHDHDCCNASSLDEDTNVKQIDPHDMICPGTTWCDALGGASLCHEVALLLEPHYGRGSGGEGDDANQVHLRLTKAAHAHSCTSDTIENAKVLCKDAMESCGLAPTMKIKICDRLVCPNQFLHAVGGDGWLGPWHGKDWNEASRSSGSFGVVSYLTIVILVVSTYGLWRYDQAVQRWKRSNALEDVSSSTPLVPPPPSPPSSSTISKGQGVGAAKPQLARLSSRNVRRSRSGNTDRSTRTGGENDLVTGNARKTR